MSSSTDRVAPPVLSEMASLLDQSEPFKRLRRGEVVVGEVMHVDQESILVNIGHKSEGEVPLKEMRSLSPEELASMRPGDEIIAYVIRPDSDEGTAILSIDKAQSERAWRLLQRHLDNNTAVEGVIRGFNKGGVVVDVSGIQGFVPLSQLAPMGKDEQEAQEQVLAKRVGQKVSLRLLELNQRRNRVVLSERQAIQEKRDKEKGRLLEELREGEVRRGKVSGISDFGVFVDMGGADGLVHISEMSWQPVQAPTDMVHLGDEVEVYVLKVDKESRKIALSFRRLQAEPWQTVADTYQVGQLVQGTITRLTNFGAFARIEGSVEGLIHISELANREVRHPKEVVGEGDVLTLKIIKIEPERRRLGLSLKQVEEDGWREGEPVP